MDQQQQGAPRQSHWPPWPGPRAPRCSRRYLNAVNISLHTTQRPSGWRSDALSGHIPPYPGCAPPQTLHLRAPLLGAFYDRNSKTAISPPSTVATAYRHPRHRHPQIGHLYPDTLDLALQAGLHKHEVVSGSGSSRPAFLGDQSVYRHYFAPSGLPCPLEYLLAPILARSAVACQAIDNVKSPGFRVIQLW